MVISISVLLLICITIEPSIAFYLQNNETESDNNVTRVIENFRINPIDVSSAEEFPKSFYIEFVNDQNSSNSLRFNRLFRHDKRFPVHSSDVFTIGDEEKIVRYSLKTIKTVDEFELYVGEDGKSVATLIKNSNINDFYHKYRMLGTLYDKENNLYQLIPVNNHDRNRVKREAFDSNKNSHILMKNNQENNEMTVQKDYDELVYKAINDHQTSQKKKTKKRILDKPVELYVELLLVTDRTIFEDHKRYAQTDDNDLTFLHMRTYFTHYINGVNQRFQNSFANDPDLRIHIKLKNFLFLTTDSDWTNVELVGQTSVKQHKSRAVVLTHETLDAFREFMNSRKFPFTYDHALGLFNKDLWTKSGSSVQERASVVGFSYQSRICTDHKYAIAEEIGGFLYMSIAAHEIGHNMGLGHDGDLDPISLNCSPLDNYVMTPTIGSNTKNLTNQLKFSNCSILLLKSIFLNDDFDNVSEKGECLSNVPSEEEFEEIEDMTGVDFPGFIWDPNDQCRMIYGSNASFCHFLKDQMCTSLACRTSPNEAGCSYLSGNGAIQGTICGSGKICSNGECILDERAPLGDCLYGDDIVVNMQVIKQPLPYLQMKCEDVFVFLRSINQFPVDYCSVPIFRETCCNTCRRYQGMKCVDKHPTCPQYKALCSSTALFNGEPLKKVCARTCENCKKEPLFCQNETFNCKNGGKCRNITDYNDDDYIAYTCECPVGYSGYLCELKNPCEPNPCGDEEKCQRIGSLGHKCVCDSSSPSGNCPLKTDYSNPSNSNPSNSNSFQSFSIALKLKASSDLLLIFSLVISFLTAF